MVKSANQRDRRTSEKSVKTIFAKSDARDALASLGSGMTLSNIGIHY